MKIQKFVFNPFYENTFIIYDNSRQCAVIDPGCYEKQEQQELTQFISNNHLQVVKLINTHCHIDHVLGNHFIQDQYNVPLILHKKDEPLLKAVGTYASNYGFPAYTESSVEGYLDEGDKLVIGNTTLEILHLPGHSPGHIGLIDHKDKICISGDVLFQNSIGRTDLPGGSHDTLIQSIREKLFTLPDDYTVYCGHGPETNIGFEKRTNPFCGINV